MRLIHITAPYHVYYIGSFHSHLHYCQFSLSSDGSADDWPASKKKDGQKSAGKKKKETEEVRTKGELLPQVRNLQ